MITYKILKYSSCGLQKKVKQKVNVLFDLLCRNQEVQIFTCKFAFMKMKFDQ